MSHQGTSEKYTHCECGTPYDGIRYYSTNGGRPICSACYKSTGESAEISHLRAQLAEAEKSIHTALWGVEAYNKKMNEYAAERDAAQARVGELEGLLRRCQPHIRYDKSCQCSGCDGLRQLNLSIDAALATSPHRLAGRGE